MRCGNGPPALSIGKAHIFHLMATRAQGNQDIEAYLLDICTKRGREAIHAEFKKIRFEPYSLVVLQMRTLLRTVNKKWKAAGLSQINGQKCLRF